MGLDRSGPPPPETLPDAPLRPLTIPNAIGLVRLLLIPVFLVVAWDDGGASLTAGLIYLVVAYGDYIDGIAARVTGQYSRLGAMLDPVIDRLLVISGVVVCIHFELVPAVLLWLLVARELLMLVGGAYGLRRGVRLEINWWGRWGVWPAMGGLFFAICGAKLVATLLLAAGLVLLSIATVEYYRSARSQLAESKTST
ncbi:MAG: CDP-alcohol phosphatidyltransferase family protein [Actinobacteria bacterium]|nr:CDP-alcohol phosphatidyltransferase family protein [Actinomycetota bacterium]